MRKGYIIAILQVISVAVRIASLVLQGGQNVFVILNINAKLISTDIGISGSNRI